MYVGDVICNLHIEVYLFKAYKLHQHNTTTSVSSNVHLSVQLVVFKQCLYKALLKTLQTFSPQKICSSLAEIIIFVAYEFHPFMSYTIYYST